MEIPKHQCCSTLLQRPRSISLGPILVPLARYAFSRRQSVHRRWLVHIRRPQTPAWPRTREGQRQRRRQGKRRQEQQTPETAGAYSTRRCCPIACCRISTRRFSHRLGGTICNGRPTTSMDQQQRFCLINRIPPRRPETSSHIRPSFLLRRARIQHYPQWCHLPTNA